MQNDIHKSNWLKSIFKHGKWYIFSSFFTKGINILLVPIYTKYLSPTDYGILNTLITLSLLMPLFISLYLDAAFARFFHEYKTYDNGLKKLYSTIFWFVFAWGIVLTVSFIILSYFWLEKFLAIPFYPFAILAFTAPLIQQLGNLGAIFLKQSLEAKQTTIVETSSVLINTIVTLILLINFNFGVLARLIGGLVGALFIFIFYLIYFTKNNLLFLYVDKQILKKGLIYSLPLLPMAASGWINSFSDRIVLAKYSSLQDVGLFSLAYQAAMILYVLMDAITQVQSPLAMSGLIHDKQNTFRKLSVFLTMLFIVMASAHLTLTYFAKEIVLIFANKRYFHAYKVIGIIGTIYVFGALQRPIADIISFHKKTWVLSSGVLISAFINLALNIIFVPMYGYFASAFITCISTVFYFVWLYYWVFKFEKITLELQKNLIVALVYISAIILYYTLFYDKFGMLIFIYKIIVFVIFLSIMFIFSIKWFAKEKDYNPLNVIKKIVS